jgi:hypothetical protein
VPLLGERDQRREDSARRRAAAARHARPRGVEHAPVAGDEPGIEQGEGELGIALVDLVELRELTDLMADCQSQIPERLQQRIGELLLRPRQPAVEDDEQIDVGVEAERAAPVAANRANRPWRVAAGAGGNLPDEIVHLLGVAGDGVYAAASPEGLGGIFVPRRREHRAGRNDGSSSRQ